MIQYYSGLISFHSAYRKPKGYVSMDDVLDLIGELKDTASVFVREDDSVVVLEHEGKYAPQKKYHKAHYTKLSASLPRELVSDFAQACRTLGISQVSVLKPAISCAIEKAASLAAGKRTAD
jgi:hypothetical protein